MDTFLLVLGGLFVVPALVAGSGLFIALMLWRGSGIPVDFGLPIIFFVFGSVFLWITLRRAKRLRAQGDGPMTLMERIVWASPYMAAVGAIAGAGLVVHLDLKTMASIERSAAQLCAGGPRASTAAVSQRCVEAAIQCRYQVRREEVPMVMQSGAQRACLDQWIESESDRETP